MDSEYFMRRAIELARLGKGKVNPNPMVGAVLVKDGKIIGEGYHHNYGNLHAERDAIKDCLEKGNSPENATIYVTLEPCCHQGKQPPCTQALIDNKISQVFVGSSDPNPLVKGKGVQILRDHNIQVTEDFLKDECDKLNPVFFHYITKKTPYITLKYAMTADGKTATSTGDSKWISGEESRKLVHQMRSENMAILVGANTVRKDNPLLNVRAVEGKNPVRIVLDSKLSITEHCQLVQTAGEIKTIVFTCADDIHLKARLEKLGVEIITVASKNGKVDLKEAVKILGEKGIDSLIVEGGAHINSAFMKEGLVNKVVSFVCPKFLGASGISAAEGEGAVEMKDCVKLELERVQQLEQDIMLEYKVKDR